MYEVACTQPAIYCVSCLMTNLINCYALFCGPKDATDTHPTTTTTTRRTDYKRLFCGFYHVCIHMQCLRAYVRWQPARCVSPTFWRRVCACVSFGDREKTDATNGGEPRWRCCGAHDTTIRCRRVCLRESRRSHTCASTCRECSRSRVICVFDVYDVCVHSFATSTL